MKSNNLFDNKITFLDVVKIFLLIVTMFSTWMVVDILTPPSNLAFIREIAAVLVVEGAFLGFEAATKNAKSKEQVKLATIGFFCSLAVISIFAATSGLLEFGGESLLTASAGNWLNMAWTVKHWVITISLGILVAWIAGLATIYRLYSLADPDERAAIDRIAIEETVTTEANEALKAALAEAKPVVATARAIAKIRKDFEGELTPDAITKLEADVKRTLNAHYYPTKPAKEKETPIVVDPEVGFVRKQATTEGPAASGKDFQDK